MFGPSDILVVAHDILNLKIKNPRIEISGKMFDKFYFNKMNYFKIWPLK